jgi:hypothetical protein
VEVDQVGRELVLVRQPGLEVELELVLVRQPGLEPLELELGRLEPQELELELGRLEPQELELELGRLEPQELELGRREPLELELELELGRLEPLELEQVELEQVQERQLALRERPVWRWERLEALESLERPVWRWAPRGPECLALHREGCRLPIEPAQGLRLSMTRPHRPLASASAERRAVHSRCPP